MIRFHICQNIRGPHRHRGQHLRAKTAVSRGWHQSPPPRPSSKGHTTAEICIIVSRTVNSSTAKSRTVEIRTVEIHCVIVLTNQSGPLGTRRRLSAANGAAFVGAAFEGGRRPRHVSALLLPLLDHWALPIERAGGDSGDSPDGSLPRPKSDGDSYPSVSLQPMAHHLSAHECHC